MTGQKSLAPNFPRCVGAVRKSEVDRWALADALVAEVESRKGDDPDIRIFDAVSAEIERETGVFYEPRRLQTFRLNALKFPPKVRREIVESGVRIAFETCVTAGSPEKLFDLITHVKKTKKAGKKPVSLSQHEAQRIMQAWKIAADKQLEREIEKQRRQLEQAKSTKQEAQERVRNAKTETERERAKAAIAKADEVIEQSQVPPKRDPNYRPDPEMIPAMLVPFDIASELANANEVGRYVNEQLDESLSKLDDAQLESLEHDISETIALFAKALNKVQKKRGKNVVKFIPRAS